MEFHSLPTSIYKSPCLEKLDALNWSGGFCIDFEGRYLGVRTNEAAILQQLAGLAQQQGTLIDGRPCESLLSFKLGKQSQRKGVKHFHLLYSLHHLLKKSLEVDEILSIFSEALKLAAIKLKDQFIHIDESRLFAWRANERLISVEGPADECRTIVSALRPHLEPERSSFTSIGPEGKTLFAPWDLKWRGRIIHQPLPLTDLVMLTADERPLSRAQIILRLFEMSSGKIAHKQRIAFLSQALEKTQLYSLPIGDLTTLPQRFLDLLGLEAIPDKVSLPDPDHSLA